MRDIDLRAVPNQELTVNIDDNRWTLRIKAARNTMAADVYLNDVAVVLGQRIVAGEPIIPYRYKSMQGNFVILTSDDEIPWYESFGDTQHLVYMTAAELGL